MPFAMGASAQTISTAAGAPMQGGMHGDGGEVGPEAAPRSGLGAGPAGDPTEACQPLTAAGAAAAAPGASAVPSSHTQTHGQAGPGHGGGGTAVRGSSSFAAASQQRGTGWGGSVGGGGGSVGGVAGGPAASGSAPSAALAGGTPASGTGGAFKSVMRLTSGSYKLPGGWQSDLKQRLRLKIS